VSQAWWKKQTTAGLALVARKTTNAQMRQSAEKATEACIQKERIPCRNKVKARTIRILKNGGRERANMKNLTVNDRKTRFTAPSVREHLSGTVFHNLRENGMPYSVHVQKTFPRRKCVQKARPKIGIANRLELGIVEEKSDLIGVKHHSLKSS
jgi:hypothetical protein